MEGSQINSVRVDGAAASVSATFREAVVAHRGASEPVQAFRCRGRGRAAAAGGADRAGAQLLAVGRQHSINRPRAAAWPPCLLAYPCSVPLPLPVSHSHHCRSEYSVDYELALEPSGSWVITAATVRG